MTTWKCKPGLDLSYQRLGIFSPLAKGQPLFINASGQGWQTPQPDPLSDHHAQWFAVEYKSEFALPLDHPVAAQLGFLKKSLSTDVRFDISHIAAQRTASSDGERRKQLI